MRINCHHKATQCPLMGPATENRVILANGTMPDNIVRCVRRVKINGGPMERTRELPIKDYPGSA
jgi:hypothetical protein